ncbi:MAG: hypothetical protein JNN27_00135 [Planctomycetes bacterium]|nr:hypothetical protein [Planctomycetota bacterium]
MTPTNLRALLTSGLLLAGLVPLAGAQVLFFSGPPGGSGNVVRVDRASGQPGLTVAGLDNVRLLRIDRTGRVELDQLRPDRARLRTDIPLASRLDLPAGAGSLYRFQRPVPGGFEFGLFVVDAAGDARIVFQQAGLGAAGDLAPFSPFVAVAPNGDRVLVLTDLAAGGDAIEVELATGAQIVRTSALPPQSFADSGAHIGAGWAVVASAAGVWRFPLVQPGDAQVVDFGAPAPAHFSAEVALSRNGQFAVTTAGLAPGQQHVFAFGPSGAAVQVTGALDDLSPAGYQPQHRHGPYLAISDDGSHVAWRVQTAVSTEAFLARTSLPAPRHLTHDVNFIDTIDEIGDFFFRPGTNRLVFAAGETAQGGAPILENLDYYSAELPASGAEQLLNLTLSSGVAAPPFVQPADLEPLLNVFDPASGLILLHTTASGGSGDLIVADSATPGLSVALPNVKDLQFLEAAGGVVWAAVRRSNGAKPVEVFRFDPALVGAGAPLLSVNSAHLCDRFAPGPGTWAAFVERTPNKERLWRFDPSAGALVKFSERALFYGPTLTWTPSGELAFSVGQGGVLSLFAVWPTNAPVLRLPTPVAPGFLLPGV